MFNGSKHYTLHSLWRGLLRDILSLGVVSVVYNISNSSVFKRFRKIAESDY